MRVLRAHRAPSRRVAGEARRERSDVRREGRSQRVATSAGSKPFVVGLDPGSARLPCSLGASAADRGGQSQSRAANTPPGRNTRAASPNVEPGSIQCSAWLTMTTSAQSSGRPVSCDHPSMNETDGASFRPAATRAHVGAWLDADDRGGPARDPPRREPRAASEIDDFRSIDCCIGAHDVGEHRRRRGAHSVVEIGEPAESLGIRREVHSVDSTGPGACAPSRRGC